MSETGSNPREPDAWSFEHPSTVEMFSDQRLTVSLVLEEENTPPPVMFSSRVGLVTWAEEHGLCCDNLKEHDKNFALRVHGDYRAANTYFRYEHVWVLASYRQYGLAQRDAADLIYSRGNIDPASIDEELEEDGSDRVPPSEALRVHKVDADHVINKSSLKEHQPEAWVLLFPVPRNANRGFGAKFERFYPSVSAETNRVDLPSEVAFKLYCGAMPKTKEQFVRAMGKVRGQLDPGLDVTRRYVDLGCVIK